MSKFKVNEIFKSIEGEGIRTGEICTFIRFYGCNLNCSYCDTQYACVGDDYKDMTVVEIVENVNELGARNITLTGGEPLLQKDLPELINKLTQLHYKINIETNGSINVKDFKSKLNPHNLGNVFFTIDYKMPCSKMSDKMDLDNFNSPSPLDVYKFVVSDINDLNIMKDIIDTPEFNYYNIPAYVSPVFGKIEPKDIVEFILDRDLQNCKVQVQLHKIIWDPDMRGV